MQNEDYDVFYNKKYQTTKQDLVENYIENLHYLDSQVKERSSIEKLQVNSTGVDFRKGEEIGMFEMGSTIVLVFEGP